MAKQAGSIYTSLTLEDSSFQVGLKRAAAATERTALSIEKGFASMRAASVAFFASLSVGAIASFSKTILDFADDLGTAADQVNINVERFQTLREGFRALEVDGAAFEKGMKRLTDTLGAVQSGTAAKGVVAVLDRMGVTARVTSGEIKTTDQFLDAIAGSAKKFGTEAQFTNGIVELLGKKIGVDFAAALRDGGAGLHELEQGLRDSGGVLSKEMIDKLADANETVDHFVSLSKQKLVIWAADVIDLAGQAWDALSGRGRPADPGGDDIGKRVTALAKAQADARRTLADLADNRIEIPGNFLTRGYRQLRPDVAEAERKRLRAEIASFDRQIDALKARGRAQVAALDLKDTPPVPTVDRPVRSTRSARSKVSVPDPSPALLRMRDIESIPLDITFEKPLVDLEKLNRASASFTATLTAASHIDLTQAIDPENLANFEHFAYRLSDFTGDVAAKLVGLNDISFGGLLKQFESLILQLTVIEPLVNSVRGAMSGMSLGKQNSLGGVNLLGSIAGLFGGAFANGGNPPMGKISLVGERGPELFVPRVPGTIIPNGGWGGGQQAITVYVEAAEDFNVRIDRRAMAVAVPIGQQAVVGGAALAQTQAAKRRRRMLV